MVHSGACVDYIQTARKTPEAWIGVAMGEVGEVADSGSVSKMEPAGSPDGLDGMDA